MQMSNGHNAIQIVNDYIIMFSITEPLPSLVDTFDSEELAGPPKFERVDTNKLNNLIAAVRKDKEKYDDFFYPETEDHETDYENDDSTAKVRMGKGPSTVTFTARETLVGKAAHFKKLLDLGNVLYNTKRSIRRKFEDPVVQENKIKYPFDKNN